MIARITAIEGKYRADLETWKIQAEGEIRKDSVNRARSTLKGKIAEPNRAGIAGVFSSVLQMPVLSGSPVDYIIFYGLTEVADDKRKEIRIVFMDVKV